MALDVAKISPIRTNSELELRSTPDVKSGGIGGFDKLLRDNLRPQMSEPEIRQPLKFSSHALSRIKERGISMSNDMMQRLEKAVQNAELKGSKDSLILADNAAFIVSVKNKTVVTVVDRNQLNGNVFTNIDSTVVI